MARVGGAMRAARWVLTLLSVSCVRRGSVGVLPSEDLGADGSSDVVAVEEASVGDLADVAGDDGPLPRCEVGYVACGARCVDTRSDAEHCGACDNACPTRADAPERYGCFVGQCGHAVIDLAVGAIHGCAVLRQGTVHCWGHNSRGQLGDNNTRDSPRGLTIQALAVGDATQVAVGFEHTCVRRVRGGVSCWGRNDWGQLGDGSLSDSGIAVEALGLAGASSVSVGERHSCGAAEGSAWCWGQNEQGALGTGDIDDRVRPTRVLGVDRADEVVVGDDYGCARVGARAWCWGSNTQGQLGRGNVSLPQVRAGPLEGVPELRQLAAGSAHACALTRVGEAWCWGANHWGQVGDDSRSDWEPPRRVRFEGNLKFIAASPGGSHTCAIDERDHTWCWGHNDHGQLGDGTRQLRTVPTRAVEIEAVRMQSLHVGAQASCAIEIGGLAVWCWGDGGAFGLPEGTASLRPTRITLVPPVAR